MLWLHYGMSISLGTVLNEMIGCAQKNEIILEQNNTIW